MQLAHRPTKLLITGKSGSGKSTYFTRFVTSWPAAWRFIYDHEGEFAQRTGLPAAHTPREMLEHLSARRWVIFDPAAAFPGDVQRGFAFFSEWAFSVSQRLQGKKLFCCDELQKLTGTNQVGWELACVVETGRRYEIDTCFISQQPNLIHNRLRNCLSEVATFAQVDANAIQFLAEVGFNEESVRALRPGEYLCRNLNTGAEERGRVF
jgi:ABC-type dipeptide/oligopeptide/nickel transport system ATPase component